LEAKNIQIFAGLVWCGQNMLPPPDLIIAATALHHGLTVVTSETRSTGEVTRLEFMRRNV